MIGRTGPMRREDRQILRARMAVLARAIDQARQQVARSAPARRAAAAALGCGQAAALQAELAATIDRRIQEALLRRLFDRLPVPAAATREYLHTAACRRVGDQMLAEEIERHVGSALIVRLAERLARAGLIR